MTEHRRAPPVVACGGKARLTFKQAEQFARKLSRRTDAAIKPYKCPYCNYYHMGEVDHYDRKKAKRMEAQRRLDDE